jgi:glutamyl-Q tRNA(Asp) synthetase
LASFLDARHHQGRWLLRMDDLDTPRNKPGAVQAILDCLEAYGLHWDGEVYYQSRHLAYYAAAIELLQPHLYGCVCSRKQLADYPQLYPGFCRERPRPKPWSTAEQEHAIRIKCQPALIAFTDGIQGEIVQNMALQHGDFIIKRKDGIIAYQLAVVVDDHNQQINRIVRGYDLLDSTPKQIFLQRLLGYAQPTYQHVPIIIDQQGHKLSKQTGAQAVDLRQTATTLYLLLCLLNQQPPANLRSASVADILQWGIEHWQTQPLIGLHSVPALCRTD